VSAWVWTFGFTPALTFGLLLYPDARLPSPRWRWAVVVSALGLASLAVPAAFAPGPLLNHPVADNPLGIPGTGPLLRTVAMVGPWLVWVGFAAGVASLVARWRRAPAGGVARRQISLLALAAGLCLAIVLAPPVGSGEPPWPVAAALLAVFALVPAAIGVAILRHHLYDIDVALNRSLVYAGLTAGVIALYAALIWALGRLLGSGTSASVLATGTVAAIVLPLRAWLQRLVDRAMYGDRGDPYAAVSRLTTRLQAAAEPGEALRAVAEAIAASLRLPYGGPRQRAGRARRAVRPRPSRRRSLTHQGQYVGRLLVDGRDRQPLATRDHAPGRPRPPAGAPCAASLADALGSSRRRSRAGARGAAPAAATCTMASARPWPGSA
jgi:hypothetical protein